MVDEPVRKSLELEILRQPDDRTCGPTCLHAVYRFFDRPVPLEEVVAAIPQLDEGGTLAVVLGCDALKRGFDCTIYTCNLNVFDPTWFRPGVDLSERLRAQMAVKDVPKLHHASRAYLEFIARGGQLRMEDLNGRLIRKYLNKSVPILTGMSSTFLYRDRREYGDCIADDIRGYSCGHFVVLCGYDKEHRMVMVADPYLPNPLGHHYYEVSVDRAINAILLGVLTYDANLLVIQPRPKGRRE